jgi:hypothetical protein
MDHNHRDDASPRFWRSRFGIGWTVLAAVAAWFLWTEHQAHLLGVLPYLFLLACPLMHVFMHHGHGHGAHHGSHPDHGGDGPGAQARPGDDRNGGGRS